MPYGPAEERLVQLISRAFKARVGLLLLLLVCLFVVWTTEKHGPQKAKEVELDFCRQVVGDPSYELRGYVTDTCTDGTFAKIIIEEARQATDREIEDASTIKDPDQNLKVLQNYLNHTRQLRTYEYNIRRAYEINVSFPYAKSPVALNGVLLLEGWPVFALLGICAAFALRFKQTCYEIYLSALVRKDDSKGERARDLMLTDFSAGSISEMHLGSKKMLLYKRPITLTLETIISGTLSVVVGLFSIGLLATYLPEFLSDVAQNCYYFLLYLFALVLTVCLFKSRTIWRHTLNNAVGGTVLDGRSFFLRKWLNALRSVSEFEIPLETIIVVICAIGVAVSLFFWWSDSFKGYQLFWRLSLADPDDYLPARIKRILLGIALAFFVVSVPSGWARRARSGKLLQFGIRTRRGIAYLLLAIVGFPLLYIVVYGYGWLLYGNLLRVLGGGVNTEAILRIVVNSPIEQMDLAKGFQIFLCSIGVLALTTLMLTVDTQSPGDSDGRN